MHPTMDADFDATPAPEASPHYVGLHMGQTLAWNDSARMKALH
jgi:hypothetical protein